MNLHKQIYQEIEKEISELSFNIFFTEDQLSVYSNRISKLFMDISNEIESVSLVLYKKLSGPRDKISYRNCIRYIEAHSSVDSIPLLLNANCGNFSPRERILYPFDGWERSESPSRSCGWYLAYQYLKHDKEKDKILSMRKYGTLHYLLTSLSALYLLNCCYSSDDSSKCSSMGSCFFTPVLKNPDGEYYVWKDVERAMTCVYLADELQTILRQSPNN